MTAAPRVSVLLSIRNGGVEARRAIESVLAQTFTEFELLVGDDASTDGLGDILRQYSDPRIRVLTNSVNVGLTATLNTLIAASRAPYLARIDADDWCLPHRLERQVAFLDANSDVALVGSFCRCVRDDGAAETWTYPVADCDLRSALTRRNVFVHSSVMFRRSAVEAVGAYDLRQRYVQDYELWGRIAARFAVANIPEVLVMRRLHVGALSQSAELAWRRFLCHARAQFLVARALRRPYAAAWIGWHFAAFLKWRLAAIGTAARRTHG